jgi:hypothetical protein
MRGSFAPLPLFWLSDSEGAYPQRGARGEPRRVDGTPALGVCEGGDPTRYGPPPRDALFHVRFNPDVAGTLSSGLIQTLASRRPADRRLSAYVESRAVRHASVSPHPYGGRIPGGGPRGKRSRRTHRGKSDFYVRCTEKKRPIFNDHLFPVQFL